MSKKLFKCTFNKVVKGIGSFSTSTTGPFVENVKAGTFREARQIIRDKYSYDAKRIIVEEIEDKEEGLV